VWGKRGGLHRTLTSIDFRRIKSDDVFLSEKTNLGWGQRLWDRWNFRWRLGTTHSVKKSILPKIKKKEKIRPKKFALGYLVSSSTRLFSQWGKTKVGNKNWQSWN